MQTAQTDTAVWAMLTTAQTATRLGVSRRRVHQLIAARRLPATKFGVAWMIRERDLANVADRRPGRPRKAAGGRAEKPPGESAA